MTTIIFALLAAFVVWKLRSVLGTRNGTEKPPINPFTSRAPRSLGPRPGDPSREPSSRVIPLPGAAEPPVAFRANPNERWKPYAEPGSNAWSGLDSIAAADPAFNVASFINGAKAAYEMIIAAFASGDRTVLRNLLSPRFSRASQPCSNSAKNAVKRLRRRLSQSIRFSLKAPPCAKRPLKSKFTSRAK